MLIDKLAWIELKDQKILSTLSKGKDKFYIPGGKREEGESDTDALKREIKEELSVELVDDSIQYLETFQAQAHGHAEGVEVKMTCYTSDYRGELKPDSEIERIVWLNFKDIDKVSPVDKIIFRWLKEKELLK
ncbi:NUDIX domain-containing protein [Leptobacterium flavescens]|uniref:NUDIX domain-containing protein n=1 Tax=Leptobacterium flavescens TaxID=472055 RepID=A0A6P0UQP3_9FLAO|nr:NUDIX domain-containing protein [Leptobacterium flavescens]NER15435.1 NUDIX domain-containing protein [Leptobacterium flavescens]